jgi:hypothetical protein
VKRTSRRAERLFPPGKDTTAIHFMSPNDIRRQSGCVGKEQFTNQAQARFVMSRVTAKSNRRLRTYRCGHCGHYHFGETGWD